MCLFCLLRQEFVLDRFGVYFRKMDNKPRLRGPNFTRSDNLLLCDIISKYKDMIDNKQNDGTNLLQKQKAWVEVMEEFNAATTEHHRTVESLQQNYKNLKKKRKKSAACAKLDIPEKRKLDTDIPEEQSVAEKFKVLAAEKMEYIGIQKELVKIQLIEEKEKLDHNRLLRLMELEDAKAKYAHNKKLRELELENILVNKLT